MELHRCRSEEQQAVDGVLQIVGQLVGEVRRGLTASVGPANAVRLVEDHQVPTGLNEVVGVLGVSDQVDAGDDVVDGRPGVAPALPKDLEGIAVQDGELLVELAAELRSPLRQKRSGRDDQNALQRSSGAELLQDESGFDRLSQAHLISQDHAGLELVHDPVGDEDLVGRRFDSGARESSALVVLVGVLEQKSPNATQVKLAVPKLAFAEQVDR